MTLDDIIGTAVAAGDLLNSTAIAELIKIESQTGPGTRHLLHTLLQLCPDAVYLEIGLRYGGSFCSTLGGNRFKAAYGIDLPMPENTQGVREQIVTNVSKIPGDITLHFEDCWVFEPARIRHPVTVYFFDGPHEKEDHFQAIRHYQPCLNKDFILIVDDWNWEGVRLGTLTGLESSGMRILSSVTRESSEWMAKYYNGLFVAHIQK